MRKTLTIIFVALLICRATQARAATPISACGTAITKSGSYVVTKNLTVKKGSSSACITVGTNYVAIDLGGFTINCGGQLVDGISDKTINFNGIIVRNGIVSDCHVGVNLDSHAVLVDGLSTLSNVTGIFLGNNGNNVMRSVSNDNQGGMFAFDNTGIFIECISNAIDNTALNNSFGNLRTDQSGCASFNNLAP